MNNGIIETIGKRVKEAQEEKMIDEIINIYEGKYKNYVEYIESLVKNPEAPISALPKYLFDYIRNKRS